VVKRDFIYYGFRYIEEFTCIEEILTLFVSKLMILNRFLVIKCDKKFSILMRVSMQHVLILHIYILYLYIQSI